MNINYETIFPFSMNQDCFLYNGESGMIYPSIEPINCELLRMSASGVKEYEASEELNDYLNIISDNRSHEKTRIRNHTKITEEQWKQGNVVHKLWLSLTESCNMKCKYCFGEYGERETSNFMSVDMARKCIDYFFKYANKDIDYYSVRFFGGEPLLNSKVVKFSIEYINKKAKERNKRISYLLTTNGTIMDDEIMEMIIANNISINISIDGNRDIHNFCRVFKNGEGSFEKVAECVNKFRGNDYKNIIARMTLSKPGVATFKKDVEYLWNIGFDQVYVDIAETNRTDLLIDADDMKKISLQMGEILNLMMVQYLEGNFKSLRNITDVYCFIDKKLLKESCMYFNPFTIQFTPSGDIYKCCRTLNKADKYSGNINEGVSWKDFYRSFHYDQSCNECWAKRLCGGGCKSIDHKDLYCEFAKIIYSNSLKYYIFVKRNMDKIRKQTFLEEGLE